MPSPAPISAHDQDGPLFYLGAHQPHWLWDPKADFPLFVSRRQLSRYRQPLVSTHPWALDSGGFTELQKHGRWTITAAQYVREVRRYRHVVARMQWAAPMDWMCEPAVIQGGTWKGQRFAGTGLSVREHQERTVANYLELRALAPDLPFVPVVQGWTLADYLACVELYAQAGVELASLPLVGLGSVCRRESTAEIERIVRELHRAGLRMHGFGVKIRGLHRYGRLLVSADSNAWSYGERRRPGERTGGSCRTHRSCSNCLKAARLYRADLLRTLQGPVQGELFDLTA